MQNYFRPIGFAAVLALGVAICHADIILPKIFGDHMVLQRGMDAPIWGKAEPGEEIQVRADWRSRPAATTAGPDGRWRVKLPTPKPGGPHTITITGKNEIVLRDVLVGDVWVCSGQSNMEMPVGNFGPGYDGVDNWQEELKSASQPNIRLFTVPNRHAVTPQFDCDGAWSVCNAETAKAFSAAGFFFGRELHQALNIPIGLVSADYGGTVAEAWTSEETIKRMPDFADQLAAVVRERDHSDETAKARAATISDWTHAVELADGNAAFAALDVDDSTWVVTPKLEPWSGELAGFDGYVWFRKTFKLPAEWAQRELVLDLGPIDDMDFTYVNGKKVGQTMGEQTWNVPRSYPVPKGLLNPETNIIAVRVLDTGGQGGITGPAQLRSAATQEVLPLDHDWRSRAGAKMSELPQLNLSAQVGPNTATVLFNGMLAPIIPFGIRGAIWYQGESNIGRDEQYRQLFPAMIADWRRHWGQGNFPFYYTQIAPFRYQNPGMAAALRDAQRLSLATPNTGMAITMDSDSNNLHPHTKQAVGHRLALWALAQTYGQKKLVYSGPLYKSMKVEGAKVRLHFNHVGSGLTSNGKSLEHFMIAGSDGKFLPAHAGIDGATIVVSSDAVSKPVAVRYAWGDEDESSFGNREGLPASSFRTDALK